VRETIMTHRAGRQETGNAAKQLDNWEFDRIKTEISKAKVLSSPTLPDLGNSSVLWKVPRHHPLDLLVQAA
jgi:hypothetical protein